MPMRHAALSLWLTGIALFAQTSVAPNPTGRYYVVFLRPDPARAPLAKVDGERIQAAHMANIHKMADDGVLVAAGPFDDTPAVISGIFVFKADSLESAQAIAAKDPTVLEHRNTVDVHAWEGPPGIGEEYYELHQLDRNTPEDMQVRPLCILFQGPAWERKSSQRDALLAAHEGYIGQLKAQGKLGAAGAIEPPGDMLGLVIFKPVSFGEAQHLMEKDPAAKAGLLRVECHHWWSADHVLRW